MLIKKEESKYKSKFIYIQFALLFLIVVSVHMNEYFWVSFFFSLTFISTYLYLLYICFALKNYNSRILLFHLLGIMIASFICIFINAGGVVSLHSLRKIVIFWSTLSFYLFMSIIPVNRKMIKYIINTNLFLVIFWIVEFYVLGNRQSLGHVGITLGFPNPNLTGMWVATSWFMLVTGIMFYKNTIMKIIFVCSSILLGYILILTSARNAALSVLMFLCLLSWGVMMKRVKLNKFIIWLFLLSPLLLSLIYMWLVGSGFINKFNYFSSAGKTLDSRYYIWLDGYNHFFNNPLFGVYYAISNGTGRFQMLNSHLDILVSYGIITFLLTLTFLYSIVKSVLKNCTTKFQLINLFAFFSVITLGFAEAAFFSGGIGIYILGGAFIYIARFQLNSDDNKGV